MVEIIDKNKENLVSSVYPSQEVLDLNRDLNRDGPFYEGELQWSACPIGSTFFDELCLLMTGVAIDY